MAQYIIRTGQKEQFADIIELTPVSSPKEPTQQKVIMSKYRQREYEGIERSDQFSGDYFFVPWQSWCWVIEH